MRRTLLVALFAALSACAAVPPKSAGWSEQSYPGFVIRYGDGLVEDANYVARLTQHSIRELQEEFGVDSRTWSSSFDLEIVLYPSATDEAGPGRAMMQTRGSADGIVAELHMLAPSLHPANGRTAVGLPFDDAYFAKLITHEVATVFLEHATTRKGPGWNIYEAPAWFVQGYQEYLGLTRSSPEAGELSEVYKNQGRADRNRVRMELRVRNDYIDGALLVLFLHERFGAAAVQRMLESGRSSFWDALADETNLDAPALKRAYDEWLGQ